LTSHSYYGILVLSFFRDKVKHILSTFLNSFSELGLSKQVIAALSECGYTEPTEIQANTAELILSGRDLMASAQTGSGKTAAFALPVIECLDEPGKSPRCLVLAPTRELAIQVEAEFKRFSKYKELNTVTVYGGTGFAGQIAALRRPVDVIVATPGRLLDCIEHRYVDLSQVEILILDEADRLLDLGFMPQLRRIISKLPVERQTLMFSATLEGKVAIIAQEYMLDPVTVRVNQERLDVDSIDQQFMPIKEFDKDDLLVKLIRESEMESVLIFTGTKRKAGWVKDRLRDAGIKAEEIHSDISQAKRESTLKRYRSGAFNVLVATDVAARGLDIPAISHVINYDLPELPEDYIHRIGRTGRAGRSGTAMSFVSEEQRHLLSGIEKITGIKSEQPKVVAKKASVRRFRPKFRR